MAQKYAYRNFIPRAVINAAVIGDFFFLMHDTVRCHIIWILENMIETEACSPDINPIPQQAAHKDSELNFPKLQLPCRSPHT